MIDHHYGIMYNGKYFRYHPKTITGDTMQWITGISRAHVFTTIDLAKFVQSKFKLDYAEIVGINEGEYNYKTICSRDRVLVKLSEGVTMATK